MQKIDCLALDIEIALVLKPVHPINTVIKNGLYDTTKMLRLWL